MLWLLQKLAPVGFLKLHMKITLLKNQGLTHFYKIYLSWKTLTYDTSGDAVAETTICSYLEPSWNAEPTVD